MKKILFASTALILSAGVASANDNISFSGDARMGVVYNSQATTKTRFSARARLTVKMERVTDSGMTVGATFRMAQAGAAESGNFGMSGGNVYISGDFGKLTMGDIAGAVEGAVGGLPNIGYSELRQNVQWLSNNVAGRTAARYEYAFDGFAVMLSSDQLSASGGTGMAAIGAKYTFDGFTISAGYETGRATFTMAGVFNAGHRVDHAMIGAEAKLDMVTVKAVYGRAKNKTTNNSATQWGVSATGTIDAIGITGYYTNRLNDSKHYGIGASYALGGGAHLRGAINQSKTAAGVKTNTADFGITMSF